MNLFKSLQRVNRCLPTAVIAAAVAGSVAGVRAVEYDLSAPGSQSLPVTGAFGGTAIVADFFTQPAGTGVFQPFLTIERDAAGKPPTSNNNIEQGYNTDGFSALYLDQQRPQWNRILRIQDLANVNGYYAFELDANEPSGQGASLISIDNVRVYTSPAAGGDTTGGVKNNVGNLNNLGTLRWALNDPTKNADTTFNIQNWVKLDSEQENVEAGPNFSNGGSGKSDMILYIPITAFAGAQPGDYVWFYNLDGVHYSVDSTLAAEAGYEEWRAVSGTATPDSGMTVAMLGLGMLGLGAVRRKLS
jgi:hypothetical protein